MNTDSEGREIPNSILSTFDTCKECGSKEMEMRNYFAGDGDIHCAKCGAYVRMWNAS